MKDITKGGIALPVDDVGLDYENNPTSMVQQVTLINDDVYIEPRWIATADIGTILDIIE